MFASDKTRLGELARLFFKLGLIAFGGPAAHIAMMEDEVVERRQWLSRQHFLDLIGATNLVPGPNSTEMTMHVGYERAGWAGLAVAGICFILPAAVLTGLLGWLYVSYGTLPTIEPFLLGIKPTVLAVILGALWRLGQKAVKGWAHVLIGVAVGAALWLGVSEIVALLVGGALGMVFLVALGKGALGNHRNRELEKPEVAADETPVKGTKHLGWFLPLALSPALALPAQAVSLSKLFLFFLKVGAILYGSGYVLIAFLEAGLVQDYGWLTEQQLLDAVAIGQFTPGPVLTTATFIGFVLAGWKGAVVATLGIFLPAFVFVGILNPLVPKLRQSRWSAAFLDAVNVSAVALMLVVTIVLGFNVLAGWIPWVIFALAAVGAFAFRLNAAYLVLGGAALGWLFQWL